MKKICAAIALVIALTGCQASSPIPSTGPASFQVSPAPADGVTLAKLGFEHGPKGFSLPRGATASEVVDQPNVVTLALTNPSAATVHAYLMANLAGMGFTIDASSSDSIVFHDVHYDGALTSASGLVGITLRKAR